MDDQAETMSVEEAGKILGLSRASAYAAVNAGEIPALRIGHRWLVPRQALKILLDSAGNSNAGESIPSDDAVDSGVVMENHLD